VLFHADEVIAWMLWYNGTPMHSTLGYVSPMVFEQRWNQPPVEKGCLNWIDRRRQGVVG
jgi:hypothetical protein